MIKYILGCLFSIQFCCACIEGNVDRSLIHKISWNAYASITVNDQGREKLYTNRKYHNTIYQVIGTAISNCMERKYEFESKLNDNGIIEFDAKESDSIKRYTAAN